MTEAYRPKNAASLILVRRDTGGGIEVLLTRRPPEMEFLGGVYVFPGGSVRKEDCSEALLERCRGLTREEAQKNVGAHLSPKLCLGHWVAAIRELFEEVGVLLCVDESGKTVALEGRRERLMEKREALIEGSLKFHEFLESEKLLCDAARLAYFAHWLTPEEFPIRFDTRFYLACLPAGQSPLPASQEVSESLWISPERALKLSQGGVLPLIFPTYASLRMLADFDSSERLLAEYGLA